MLNLVKWLLVCITLSVHINAQSNSIRVVTDERKLLQYLVDGEAQGPSVDILRMLLTQADLESEIEFMPWTRAYKIALEKPNTLIMSMIRTPERENKFHWITKVSNTFYAFISLKDDVNRTNYTLAEAQSKITVTVRGSSAHAYLIEKGFSEKKNLYLVSSIEDMTKLLVNKKVDLAFTSPAVFSNYYLLKNLNSNDFVNYSPIKDSSKESYIALSKPSDDNLLKKLVNAQESIELTNEYHELIDFKSLKF
ncbi:substrate-binding periplasmic protein [Thalassotalea profundi]|uniref:Solute-binding protein family 3/N-terminal domain-containing protein n=1 Tax=Thalassotalea profundi TaxID=2036687 RepID=A0ABQ3IYY3_9GAMM|nr:transporter substrate-binding domain-containing protein [Thalassotalea profundi]GHE96124.1 hypothetical protein GCM10011501_27200 [Thalassotalea profundi]